jgi:hypothetical protein
MAVDTGDGRFLRVCDLCGKVDTAPRHSFGGPLPNTFRAAPDDIVEKVLEAAPAEHRAQLLRDLMDTSSLDLHKQCCRDAGCPTGECAEELDEVGDLLDDELRDALTERGQRLQDTEG